MRRRKLLGDTLQANILFPYAVSINYGDVAHPNLVECLENGFQHACTRSAR